MSSNRLCIVPCGKRKIWDENPYAGPTPAREAYTGVFARTCIMYAEKFCENYVILSAKHGFLFPEEKIPGPYNVTFNDPRTRPISIPELVKQAKEKSLYQYDEIIVIAGRKYTRITEAVFRGKHIKKPLEGIGKMGDMIKILREAINTGKPLV